MKLPAIKKLVEDYSVSQLKEAEQDLLEENTLSIEVEGSDDGEKLTHVLAAIWIKKTMEQENTDVPTAIRKYMSRVRNSISKK